jgi:DNA-binding transcriptional LysR family regulator
MMVFPRLIKILDETAPNIKLTAIPLGLHSLIGQLETGKTDMAFGSYPKLYAGVYGRILYKEHYVCLVRAEHPTIKDKISLADYE